MFRLLLISTIVLCALLTPTHATLGIDISSGLCASSSQADFDCFKKAGYDFVIIQVWSGGYGYNSDIARCAGYAWAAGFAHVDVYIFMCPECSGNSDAKSVVSTVYNNLKNDKVSYGMFWFDVEQCDGCWGSASGNCDYISDAGSEADAIKQPWGGYSSLYEWGDTVGSGCTAFKNHNEWYAHYDGSPSFDDPTYYKYGGWTSPSMKQYNDAGPSCGIASDVDYYPSSMQAYYMEVVKNNTIRDGYDTRFVNRR